MTCICVLKDRGDLDKICCIVCNQFSHNKCYNINTSELVFIKNKFKCRKCVRRSSVSLPGGKGVDPAKENDKKVAIVAKLPTDNCASSVIVTISTDESTSAASKPITELFPKADLCLEAIHKELITLKNNNVNLNDSVLDLREDNFALKKNNAELQRLVLELREDNLKLLSKIDDLAMLVSSHWCYATENTCGNISTSQPLANTNNNSTSSICVQKALPVLAAENSNITPPVANTSKSSITVNCEQM